MRGKYTQGSPHSSEWIKHSVVSNVMVVPTGWTQASYKHLRPYCILKVDHCKTSYQCMQTTCREAVLCQHFILFNTPYMIMHYTWPRITLSNYTIRTAICIIASSPDPSPSRRGLVHTVCACVKYCVIFFVKSFVQFLVCMWNTLLTKLEEPCWNTTFQTWQYPFFQMYSPTEK